MTKYRAFRAGAALSIAAALALTMSGQSTLATVASTPAQRSTTSPVPPRGGQALPGDSRAATIDYYYAAAETQVLASPYASGASATFTVEHPKQVPNGHSLAEIAVESPALDYTYIEAGWIVMHNRAPRLFIFWWDQGAPKCYNQGCGYVEDGAGIQPGAKLTVGTKITLTWQQQDGDWWLLVNGQPSGYYPDSQWTESFTQAGFAQVFGEVAIRDGLPVCDNMGSGKRAGKPTAAKVTGVTFEGGPAVALVKDVDTPGENYTLRLTGPSSMRYGGPGVC